jgi:hypothetical protein
MPYSLIASTAFGRYHRTIRIFSPVRLIKSSFAHASRRESGYHPKADETRTGCLATTILGACDPGSKGHDTPLDYIRFNHKLPHLRSTGDPGGLAARRSARRHLHVGRRRLSLARRTRGPSEGHERNLDRAHRCQQPIATPAWLRRVRAWARSDSSPRQGLPGSRMQDNAYVHVLWILAIHAGMTCLFE